MYIEGYLFYLSFTGIVILLSCKVRVIRKYDRANQNHLSFDPFPKTFLCVLEIFHESVDLIEKKARKPLYKCFVRNIELIHKGATKFVDDLRYGRRQLGKMIEKSGVASRYVQKIVEPKKKIRKHTKKHL